MGRAFDTNQTNLMVRTIGSLAGFAKDTSAEEHVFYVDVYLDGLDPAFVQVELYADSNENESVVRQVMTRLEATDNAESHWTTYRATVPANRSLDDFTPRIVPTHEGVRVPLELDLIRWQR